MSAESLPPAVARLDKRRVQQPANLKTICKPTSIPCDTQMRTMFVPVPPEELRPSHNTVLNAFQRGKALEKQRYLEKGMSHAVPINASQEEIRVSLPEHWQVTGDTMPLFGCLQRSWAPLGFTEHLGLTVCSLP